MGRTRFKFTAIIMFFLDIEGLRNSSKYRKPNTTTHINCTRRLQVETKTIPHKTLQNKITYNNFATLQYEQNASNILLLDRQTEQYPHTSGELLEETSDDTPKLR